MIHIIRWSTWLNDDQMTKTIATVWCIDQTNHSGRKSSESNLAKLCKLNIKILRSTTCEGQYCFISLTTSEIVLESANFKHNYEDHEEFVGINRPRYEILAGCLKVDDDRVRLCRNVIEKSYFSESKCGLHYRIHSEWYRTTFEALYLWYTSLQLPSSGCWHGGYSATGNQATSGIFFSLRNQSTIKT